MQRKLTLRPLTPPHPHPQPTLQTINARWRRHKKSELSRTICILVAIRAPSHYIWRTIAEENSFAYNERAAAILCNMLALSILHALSALRPSLLQFHILPLILLSSVYSSCISSSSSPACISSSSRACSFGFSSSSVVFSIIAIRRFSIISSSCDGFSSSAAASLASSLYCVPSVATPPSFCLRCLLPFLFSAHRLSLYDFVVKKFINSFGAYKIISLPTSMSPDPHPSIALPSVLPTVHPSVLPSVHSFFRAPHRQSIFLSPRSFVEPSKTDHRPSSRRLR